MAVNTPTKAVELADTGSPQPYAIKASASTKEGHSAENRTTAPTQTSTTSAATPTTQVYAETASQATKDGHNPNNRPTGADGTDGTGGGGYYYYGGSGGSTPAAPVDVGSVDPFNTQQAAQTTQGIVAGAKPEQVAVGPINGVDPSSMENMLQQISDAQKAQTAGQIDFATQQGINDLERAEADAQQQYQAQRDQIAADERNALDNQALYAQARGDNGGIGQAQYGSIQNNAATNRLTVNREQTRLASETARQVADLRAQGEYKKADAVLEITQSYLSQLMNLEKWAAETNLSVDEFNTQLAQWQNNFNLEVSQYLTGMELSAAQLTGAFSDGTTTLGARDALNQQLAAAAQALLAQGINLTEEQIAALGWSPEQYTIYKTKMGMGA